MAGKSQGLIAGGARGAARREPPPAPARGPLRWFEVLEDRQVPRRGGHFFLRAGKEINDANFDVAALRKAGVKLKEIETPAWYVAQQNVESPQKHAQLVEELGHDLGEHPGEYVPPSVGGDVPAAS